LYGPDHEAYRETVRGFLAREVVPYQHDWDRQHMIDRTVFARAAKAGSMDCRSMSASAAPASTIIASGWVV
jgi:Acyl-CoA dehydrogenase, N-terminal domain